MGNDNKIKISKAEVRLFLQKDMLPSENDNPEFFDLETEYAKTKKGKSHFTIWALLVCTAVVALIVYGMTAYIGYRNANLKVGIEVFEDLNLKNLLDVVSRTESSLESVTNEKIQLELDKNAEVYQAELNRDSQLLRLDSLKLSSAEKKRRTTEIQTEYDNAVAAIGEKYDSKIALLNSQIEEYKQQLASYDKKNVELAQQQEAAINSQKQLFEMEKQQLTEEYQKNVSDLNNQMMSLRKEMMEEQRKTVTVLNSQHANEMSLVDPVLLDSWAESVVTDSANFPGEFDVQNFYLNVSDDELMEQALAALSNIDSQFSDFNHIADLVQDTPWKNSLGGYVRALTSLGNKIGIETVSAAINLLQRQDELHAKEKQELLAKIAILESPESAVPAEENTVFEGDSTSLDSSEISEDVEGQGSQDAADSTEPTEPMDSTESTEPMDSTEPTEPAEAGDSEALEDSVAEDAEVDAANTLEDGSSQDSPQVYLELNEK